MIINTAINILALWLSSCDLPGRTRPCGANDIIIVDALQ